MALAHRWSDRTVALGVFVVLLLVQLPSRLIGINMLDEGAILQMASDVLHGRHLYRDAIHYAFPGIFYATAAAFAVGGTSVETARWLAIAIFAGFGAVGYRLARWWLSPAAALGAVGMLVAYRVWAYPHWQMLNYSSLAVALEMAALWLVGEALPRSSLGAFVRAGVVAGAAVLVKQDSGLATLGILGVGLLCVRPVTGRTRLGTAIAFGAGAALALGAAAIGLAWIGTLDDLVREAILAPLYGVRHFPYLGRPSLVPLVAQDANVRANLFGYFPPILFDTFGSTIIGSRLYNATPVVDVAVKIAFHLPWMIALVAGTWLVADRRPGDVRYQRDVLLWLVAVAFCAAFNRPHDWVHLLVLYPPTLFLTIVLAVRLAATRPRLRRWIAGGAWTAVGLALAVSIALVVELQRLCAVPVRSARGTLYAAPAQASTLQELLDALAAAPPGPLVSLPYHPLVNFLAARPVLSRFYVVWPVDPESRRDGLMAADLEATPDATVVYSVAQIPHFPRVGEYAPELFRYLVEHFSIDRMVGGAPGTTPFLLLRRADTTGAPPPLRLDGARVTIETASAAPRVVTGAERDRLVSEHWWPFVRAVAINPPGASTVAVAYSVVPKRGDRVTTSYGQNPDNYGPHVRFSAAVRDANGAEHEIVTSAPRPFGGPAERTWPRVEIDLTPWASGRVEVVLRVTAIFPYDPPRAYAGWEAPRLVAGGS